MDFIINRKYNKHKLVDESIPSHTKAVRFGMKSEDSQGGSLESFINSVSDNDQRPGSGNTDLQNVFPSNGRRKSGISKIMKKVSTAWINGFEELKDFSQELSKYAWRAINRSFYRFESNKTFFASLLYRQRGKNARRFVHTGMATLAAFGVMIAPVVAKEFPGSNIDPWEISSGTPSVPVVSSDPDTTTDISIKPRDKNIEYTVQEGDTISSIANKFNVSTDTVLWQNGLNEKSKIKPGQSMQILPVTGVSHKVQKGDTVYSIAKKYDSSAQAIVDFPFNSFVNDETFELAIGQEVVVPDGVKPEVRQVAPRVRQLTPDAGTVVASGTFVWPAQGQISQGFYWYHKGVDIANRSLPDVLAADSGTVNVPPYMAGGYGNYVIIDHGNGYRTLYGHLSRIYVVSGQTVARGSAIGKMGSTGRSTGPHLHFEVTRNGTYLSPLSVLR